MLDSNGQLLEPVGHLTPVAALSHQPTLHKKSDEEKATKPKVYYYYYFLNTLGCIVPKG